MKRKFLWLILLVGVLPTTMFSRCAWTQDAPRTIVITAKRFSFDPGEITLKKGQPVVLVLKSADVAHGLRFRDLNINAKINPGGTTEVRFTPDKTGNFVGHCSVFCGSGHGSMMMKIHVVD
jgi:cytochrome c oxidase subunit 2